MYYTYILQSELNSEHYYIGFTSNLKRRLLEHNSGKSSHTKKFIPWKVKTFIAFSNYQKAKQFESFLKSGNGRVFVKKHL